MSQPGVTGVLCSDNQGLALAGMLKVYINIRPICIQLVSKVRPYRDFITIYINYDDLTLQCSFE